MNKPKTDLMNVIRDQRGAGFTEYLILVGLIAVFCIAAFSDFGDAVTSKTNDFASEVSGL